MARYLVTGGAGFIGSHVAHALLARGDEVTILDCFDPYYDPALKRRTAAAVCAGGRARLVEGDLRDERAVRDALAGADKVVHLAARPGVRASLDDPRTTWEINTTGTLVLLEAMRRAGPRALVLASSSSVYGAGAQPPFREDAPGERPLSPYAASKRACELLAASYAELFGIGGIALRFFTVYGPRGRPDMAVGKFTRAALRGEEVALFGDGSVQRDFTYVDDIVRGVLAALDRVSPGSGASAVNLGGGNLHEMRELVALIEREAGRPLRVRREPPAAGDMPLTQADQARARALLGFEARVPLAEGIRRTVAWAREELA